jgi:hypothetical protein
MIFSMQTGLFSNIFSNAQNPFPAEVDVSYPLVQLVGNSRIVIEHYPRKLSSSGRYEVR